MYLYILIKKQFHFVYISSSFIVHYVHSMRRRRVYCTLCTQSSSFCPAMLSSAVPELLCAAAGWCSCVRCRGVTTGRTPATWSRPTRRRPSSRCSRWARPRLSRQPPCTARPLPSSAATTTVAAIPGCTTRTIQPRQCPTRPTFGSPPFTTRQRSKLADFFPL